MEIFSVVPPFLLALMLAVTAATIAGMWQVFEKAGESGWKALIPIYNTYVLIRVASFSGWWLVVLFLPILPQLYLDYAVDPTGIGGGPMGLEGMGLPLALGLLVLLLVFVASIVQVVVTYSIVRQFSKGLWFTIGLLILPFIFWPILGFGESEYFGPPAAHAHDEPGNHVDNGHDQEQDQHGE